MAKNQEIKASREEVEGMSFVGRGRWNRFMWAAVFSSLAALLLVAGPGGAIAQTAAQDQYSEAGGQYSDGVYQAPVGPSDPAYSGGTSATPSSTPAGGVTSPAPSSVAAHPSHAPANPGDPANPGPAPQPQQDQQAPVAVVDPFSAVIGAASPSVPSATLQTAQYLQQLLTTQQTADHLAQLLAAAAPPTGQVGLAAGINPESGPSSLDPGLASVAPGLASMLLESNCNMSRAWIGAPDGSDLNDFGHDPLFGTTDFSDVAESCSM